MLQSSIDYQRLAQELINASGGGKVTGAGLGEKSVSGTPNYTYGHGPGGLFSYPGMDRSVFTAMMLPFMGLQARLPVYPSNDVSPVYGILTGVTDTTGTEPVGVCDDPPQAGLAKLCLTSVPFGRLSRQTRVFDIDDFGRRVNRGEFFDYQVTNLPMDGSNGAPTIPGAPSWQQILNNDIAKATFELAVAWSRDFAGLLYYGSPANNTSGGGYKEPYGLTRLINNTYQDAETEARCTAADSLVRSMGNLKIAANGSKYVERFSWTARYLKHKAIRTGLWPVKWVITMPYAMFYELTEIWPCSYATYRCQFDNSAANARLVIDGMAQTQMRDAMRGNIENMTGQYLLIDGERWEVILDDSLLETSIGSGSYTSTAWFVPLTVLGSRPVTYIEFFDYRTQGGALEAAKVFAPEGSYFVSDSGRFLWHKKPPQNWCAQMLSKTQPRFVLRTPYVAARIDGIAYTPVEMFDSWDPDSPYHKDGGKIARTAAKLYPPTNS